MELLLTNGGKIIVNVARVKQCLNPETTKIENTEKEETISDAQLMIDREIISHANDTDFHLPALTLSHTRMSGRPAKKVLLPSNVSFSKTRREKDEGRGCKKKCLMTEGKMKQKQFLQIRPWLWLNGVTLMRKMRKLPLLKLKIVKWTTVKM